MAASPEVDMINEREEKGTDRDRPLTVFRAARRSVVVSLRG